MNPYGPPPFLPVALRRAAREAGQYPDRHQRVLTARIAARVGVRPEEAVVGGSASELLRASIAAFASGRSIVLPAFTYEEYRRVARAVGARVLTVPMPDLRLDPRRFAAAIPRRGVAVLANPGTPDGRYLSPDIITQIARTAERRGALLVIDESYLPFVHNGVSFGGMSESALVVFSWSKVLGLPGLPVGHAVGASSVIAAVRTQLLPWTVDAAAHQVGLAALRSDGWVRETLGWVRRTADSVRTRIGSTSEANYFTVNVGRAREVTTEFARRGFWVRDLTSMGLPRHIRFAVRRPVETLRFVAELERLLGQRSGAARA